MVVGPEAAGSLLVGEAVRSFIRKGKTHDDDDAKNAIMAGIVTSMSGVIILAAGVVRLGFLDSVLSRALLRGFISAVGFVITVDQLLPELGLNHLAHDANVSHASTLEKMEFIVKNLRNVHALTATLAFIAVFIIMAFKKYKGRVQKQHKWVVFIPDRFLVVTITTILTASLNWSEKGVEVLGPVTSGSFTLHFPYTRENVPKIRESLSTAFLIAVLGFFESVVAAKSLGNNMDANVSSNRELVALGVGNVISGFSCALPAFGGYGRSKLNASTGAKTPMSSIVLSFITIICIIWLLPFFYFIPVSNSL